MKSTQTDLEFNDVKSAIIQNLDQPKQLERLYRKNKIAFQRVFNSIFPEIKEHATARIWNERLNYEQDAFYLFPKKDLFYIFVAILVTGSIAKIPVFAGINEDFFFSRNIGFVVSPMLLIYFLWKQSAGFKQIMFTAIAVILAAIYINFLPATLLSDSIFLACIHMPILLWVILGYNFIGGDLNDQQKKIDYLRFNGDLLVMAALLVISGVIFSALTVGLFELIGIPIQKFYAEHVVVWGLSAIPILATYLVQYNPQIVNKISPVIAKIFTPIVFVTLIIFLSALIYTGKSLYSDRNFLLLFNGLLIGVMALILFSVSEATKNTTGKINLLFLFGLSLITIVLNVLALSAIAFRLAEFGLSPNRLAVLGANLLIFINLLFVAQKLYLIIKGNANAQKVENVIAFFIPIYGIWAASVAFLFPLLFQFK